MAGEISKKSGDIGEKIAEKLLEKIGWKEQIHNISIACSDDNRRQRIRYERRRRNTLPLQRIIQINNNKNQ